MASVVISKLVPSENIPMAASCRVKSSGRDGLSGVTEMEDRLAEVTVRVVFPDVLP